MNRQVRARGAQMRRVISGKMVGRNAVMLAVLSVCGGLCAESAFADGIVSLSISNDVVEVNALANNNAGTFVKSAESTISASTSSLAGYVLKIMGNNSDYAKLVNSADSNAALQSIGERVTEAQFKDAARTDYNGKWGYLPSRYCQDGVNCANNTDFLPAPSMTGDVLDATSAANSTANEYKLAIGARVDSSVKMGDYSNTYNIVLIANAVAYTITYDSGAVSGMPTDVAGTTDAGAVSISSNTPERDGYNFLKWCTVPPTNNNGTDACTGGSTYEPGSSYTLSGGGANNLKLYAMWKELPKETLADITTMQEMTPEACAATAIGTTNTLVDNRGDKKSYTVAKLADNNCWMTQNLAIAGVTLTSSDSDVTSDFTLPASSTSWTINYSTPNTYVDANGGYYNWDAATAGTGRGMEKQGADAPGSICPKGWKLPKSGNRDSGSIYTLWSQYMPDIDSYSWSGNPADTSVFPLSLIFSGNFNPWNSEVRNVGYDGYWWSSTVLGSSLAFGGRVDINGRVDPASLDDSLNGASVRCVASGE